MTKTSRQSHAAASEHERRALDAEELQLANSARNPALSQLSDKELADLVSRLRSRRNRARDIADRQGREARSKSAPSGTAPASGNAGTVSKHEYLNAALSRAMDERTARAATEDDTSEGDDSGSDEHTSRTQRALAEQAMDMKQAGQPAPGRMADDGTPLHPEDPNASDGKGNLRDTARNTAPSGALDHAGELPSRERSRTRY